jgi:hypothetical protein
MVDAILTEVGLRTGRVVDLECWRAVEPPPDCSRKAVPGPATDQRQRFIDDEARREAALA